MFFSVVELRDELQEFFDIEDITCGHFQDEKLGPLNVTFYKKIKSEKPSTDAYLILITTYVKSPIRDCEKYLRIVVGLDEDDIQIILKQFNSNSVN